MEAGNTAPVRRTLAWLVLAAGVACCIATIALAVAAKADDTRTIEPTGVIVLVVGLGLVWIGGKLLPDGGDGPDR